MLQKTNTLRKAKTREYIIIGNTKASTTNIVLREIEKPKILGNHVRPTVVSPNKLTKRILCKTNSRFNRTTNVE